MVLVRNFGKPRIARELCLVTLDRIPDGLPVSTGIDSGRDRPFRP